MRFLEHKVGSNILSGLKAECSCQVKKIIKRQSSGIGIK